MKTLIILAAIVALAGCNKNVAPPEIVITPENRLSEATRLELHLPAGTSDLTLATASDIQLSRTLDATVKTAVSDALKPKGRAFEINAARAVGNYLLLWISLPPSNDSGIDLIYSTEKKKIVGEFLGGYRG